VRELVNDTLQARGYSVLQASHGEAALKIAAAHPDQIHLLITDVVMPGMSGRELAKLLSKARSGIKVLFLSGYTEDTIIHQGALESGTAFLQKPFTLQALSRKVREILDGDSQS
jgi:DNA-binding response OmpR family regulator